jgi:hypothetical protein
MSNANNSNANSKSRELKRISLLIGEDQYEEISRRGLNLSWLLRDLLDDYFSQKKLTLEVSDETLEIYQKITNGTPFVDKEFEPFLREALHLFLKNRIEAMQKLEKTAFKKADGGKKS